MLSVQARIVDAMFRLMKAVRPSSGEVNIARERSGNPGDLFKPLYRVQQAAETIDGIPGEWAVPPDPAVGRYILYLHGGYYYAGSISSHRSLVANIAVAARAKTLAIEYRLAPEHPFPAGLEDAVTAYRWMLANCGPNAQIIVAGDSAGGGLTLALLFVLRQRGIPLPAAGVCLCPWTDLACTGETLDSNAAADTMLDPRITRKSVAYYAGDNDPRNPLISPLYGEFKGLPPLLIQVGSKETLLADSTRLAERARADGTAVTLEIWEGMQHDWHFAASLIPESRKAIEHIGKFIDQL